MLAPVNHILPLATIERERILPMSGKVLAKLNQTVNPTDVIAEATWAREHVLIDVSRTFGIPASEADELLRVKEADRVVQGAEIAVKKGIIPRTIRSQCNGRVVAAGGGQVLIETGDTAISLKAGMPGTVVQVIPDRGAIIRTVGALIQGAWGNGQIDTGQMVNLSEKPADILSASRLDVSLRGQIILTGFLEDAETLRAAAELPVRGLILSSISPLLIPAARKMHFPVVAVEGFGTLPMNSAAYKLLSSNAKREVTINAETLDRYTGARPEVIVPLPVSQEPPPPQDVETFAPDQTVRLRCDPYASHIGTIVKIHSGLVTLPSGLRARSADVKIENGEQVLVPLVNLEVVG